MPKSSKVGMNRTGIETAPELTKEMLDAPKIKTGESNGTTPESVRQIYIQESGPLGTVPAPTSFKGVLKTVMEKTKGNAPEVFIDKLGERLAFERGGVRLYDLFLTKCESMPIDGLFSLKDVQHIRDEELEHFKLVADVIESIGADSTAMTPAANAIGVASMGLVQVLSDPRSSLAQGLSALLTAELADNAGWELLIELAVGLGMDETADQFRTALASEEEHLAMVKQWHDQAVLQESGAA